MDNIILPALKSKRACIVTISFHSSWPMCLSILL